MCLRFRQFVNGDLQNLRDFVTAVPPLRGIDLRQKRGDSICGCQRLHRRQLLDDLYPVAGEPNLFMRFAERRLEKRLVARVTLSTRETDLAAMNAVVAPTNKDDPQNPVRPSENRNELRPTASCFPE